MARLWSALATRQDKVYKDKTRHVIRHTRISSPPSYRLFLSSTQLYITRLRRTHLCPHPRPPPEAMSPCDRIKDCLHALHPRTWRHHLVSVCTFFRYLGGMKYSPQPKCPPPYMATPYLNEIVLEAGPDEDPISPAELRALGLQNALQLPLRSITNSLSSSTGNISCLSSTSTSLSSRRRRQIRACECDIPYPMHL